MVSGRITIKLSYKAQFHTLQYSKLLRCVLESITCTFSLTEDGQVSNFGRSEKSEVGNPPSCLVQTRKFNQEGDKMNNRCSQQLGNIRFHRNRQGIHPTLFTLIDNENAWFD